MNKLLFLCIFACGLASALAAEVAGGADQPALPPTTVSTHDRAEQSLRASVETLEEKLDFKESPTITVDVIMFTLPMEKLQPLLPQLRDPATLGATQKKLLEFVARKEAKLYNWPQATTQQGVRGISESITEKRYPIEFGLPDLNSAKAHDAKVAHAAVPTTFETRNVGTSLIFHAALAPDNLSATMQLSVRAIDFLRFDQFAVWKNADGLSVEAPQPIVMNVAVNTTLTLREGERRLIHAAKLTDADDLACVFIAGVQISAQR